MRMDVADRTEMQACRRYIEPVAQARKAHYRLLLKARSLLASSPIPFLF